METFLIENYDLQTTAFNYSNRLHRTKNINTITI